MSKQSAAETRRKALIQSNFLEWTERNDGRTSHYAHMPRNCGLYYCASHPCVVGVRLLKGGTNQWRASACETCAKRKTKCKFTDVTVQSLDEYQAGRSDDLVKAEKLSEILKVTQLDDRDAEEDMNQTLQDADTNRSSPYDYELQESIIGSLDMNPTDVELYVRNGRLEAEMQRRKTGSQQEVTRQQLSDYELQESILGSLDLDPTQMELYVRDGRLEAEMRRRRLEFEQQQTVRQQVSNYETQESTLENLELGSANPQRYAMEGGLEAETQRESRQQTTQQSERPVWHAMGDILHSLGGSSRSQ